MQQSPVDFPRHSPIPVAPEKLNASNSSSEGDSIQNLDQLDIVGLLPKTGITGFPQSIYFEARVLSIS